MFVTLSFTTLKSLHRTGVRMPIILTVVVYYCRAVLGLTATLCIVFLYVLSFVWKHSKGSQCSP